MSIMRERINHSVPIQPRYLLFDNITFRFLRRKNSEDSVMHNQYSLVQAATHKWGSEAYVSTDQQDSDSVARRYQTLPTYP